MAALTRLELTKRLGQWSGTLAKSKITDTVTPDTDQVADLVAFVDQAWLDIQMSQNTRWRWMRNRLEDTAALTASTRTLALSVIDSTARAIAPFTQFGTYPCRYILLTHPTTAAVSKCEYVPYHYFRGYWDRGTRPEGRPGRFTQRDDGSLEFDPTPDAAYTINCDWIQNPVEFSANASEPDMPIHFHMLIVWWAMVYLMGYDENNPRYSTADRQLAKMLNRLHIEQLVEDASAEYLTSNDVYLG